jgi:hypothetical protein
MITSDRLLAKGLAPLNFDWEKDLLKLDHEDFLTNSEVRAIIYEYQQNIDKALKYINEQEFDRIDSPVARELRNILR